MKHFLQLNGVVGRGDYQGGRRVEGRGQGQSGGVEGWECVGGGGGMGGGVQRADGVQGFGLRAGDLGCGTRKEGMQ